MARKLRIAGVVFAIVVMVVVALIGSAYLAMQRERPFYRDAMQIEPQALRDGSREFEGRASAVYNDARRPGHWQVAFTAEQINGWLAIQFPEDAVKRLPEGILSPRVAIANDLLTLGFRARKKGVDTVVSVDASVMLTEAGAVAVQLASVKAGELPLPVMPIADDIAKACQTMKLPVRWTQQQGQPVAIVELHASTAADQKRIFVDTIELRDDSLFVSGHTDLAGATEEITAKDAEGAKKTR